MTLLYDVITLCSHNYVTLRKLLCCASIIILCCDVITLCLHNDVISLCYVSIITSLIMSIHYANVSIAL